MRRMRPVFLNAANGLLQRENTLFERFGHDYRRCPKLIPNLSACWRNAPGVRLICFAIFATGVRAFECLRKSACNAFDHATRFVFLAMYHFHV